MAVHPEDDTIIKFEVATNLKLPASILLIKLRENNMLTLGLLLLLRAWMISKIKK